LVRLAFRLAVLLAAAWGIALAQAAKPLLANGVTLTAQYPLNRGISYTEARPFAAALGLGYLATGGDLYLTLGARGIRLAIAATPKEAVSAKPLAAFRQNDALMIPVKPVATALGALYQGSAVSLKVTLPPARYRSHLLSQAGEADQLFVGFSRDVNLVPLGAGGFRVVGGVPESLFWPLFGRHLYGLELAPDPYGLRLNLRGAEGQPLRYAPVPGGVVFWVGERPKVRHPPQVVVDGGDGDAVRAVARAVVVALKRAGVAARVSDAQGTAARAEAAAHADVFLVVSRGPGTAVYSYRPRGRALALRFVEKAREALLLGGAPAALARQVFPIEDSVQLAAKLAEALGAPRGEAEIALLAWAPKAAALIELGPGVGPESASRIAEGVLAYLGRKP